MYLYIKDTVTGPNTVFTVLFNLCNKKTSTISEISTSHYREVSLLVVLSPKILVLFIHIQFAIRYKCRNNVVIKEKDVIDLLASVVTDDGAYDHVVNLRTPELTIFVMIIKVCVLLHK